MKKYQSNLKETLLALNLNHKEAYSQFSAVTKHNHNKTILRHKFLICLLNAEKEIIKKVLDS